MTAFVRALLVAAALLIAAPPALAQVVSTIKTPPMADSSSIIIPINIHIPAAAPNWAGAVVSGHILDATEVDVVSVTPAFPFSGNLVGFSTLYGPGSPIPSPFGPPSANLQSVPVSANFWLTGTAQASGISVLTSSSFTVATALLHVKNTAPINNSDIDVSVLLWNIYHVPFGSSSLITIGPSDLVFVPTAITDPAQLHTTASQYFFPIGSPGGLNNPIGHWLHFTDTAIFHVTTGVGSNFYATLAEQTFIGIEHVPEPATGAMIAGGLLALAAGRQARRRRLAA